MNIPDFSIPSKDCFLTTDKNGKQLKVGDVVASNMYGLTGHEKQFRKYNPIEERNGKLIIPHFYSFLLEFFVRKYCEVVSD